MSSPDALEEIQKITDLEESARERARKSARERALIVAMDCTG
jgi:hypothetical protein